MLGSSLRRRPVAPCRRITVHHRRLRTVGWTVSTLSVGGSIQATDAGVRAAVDVAADVDLPPSWHARFRRADGSVPASLDVQVSEANPVPLDHDRQPRRRQVVVSMAAGLFTADFAQVALAPTGLHLPHSQR